jgi:hypothetical protein
MEETIIKALLHVVWFRPTLRTTSSLVELAAELHQSENKSASSFQSFAKDASEAKFDMNMLFFALLSNDTVAK